MQTSEERQLCEICQCHFESQFYFDIHLKTKKHRRNVRETRAEILQKGFSPRFSYDSDTPSDENSDEENSDLPITEPSTSQQLPINNIELNDYKRARENYRQIPNKIFEEYYKCYINSVISFWAIRLALNHTVQNYKITVNEKKWSDFGNVVLEIKFRPLPEVESKTLRYVVHFKQVASYNVKRLESFEEGDFRLESMVKKITNVKAKIGEIPTRFIVFTTSIPRPSLHTAFSGSFCKNCTFMSVACSCQLHDKQECHIIAKSLTNKKVLILNTSEDNGTVYRFFPEARAFDNNFPPIKVYTCQKRMRDFPSSIDEIVSRTFDMDLSIGKDFMKYIESWENGQCGGYYKLQTEDVLVKMGHILLNRFRVTPKHESVTGSESDYAIWMQSIKQVDVTLLNSVSNLSRLLQPFSLIIERELDWKIETTTDTIITTIEHIRTIPKSILKSYIQEEKVDNNVTLSLDQLYLTFWKAGLMPLVLQVQNEHDLQYCVKIIETLKSFGLKRRYFIKAMYDDFYRPKSSLIIFQQLSDINIDQNLLNQIKIHVTPDFFISLSCIEMHDAFFDQTISPMEFFDMSLGNYVFNLSDQVGMGSTKLVLDLQMINKLRKELESKVEKKNDLLRTVSGCYESEYWLGGVNPSWFA